MFFSCMLLHQKLAIITNAIGYQMSCVANMRIRIYLREKKTVFTVCRVYPFVLSTICNNIINLANTMNNINNNNTLELVLAPTTPSLPTQNGNTTHRHGVCLC